MQWNGMKTESSEQNSCPDVVTHTHTHTHTHTQCNTLHTVYILMYNIYLWTLLQVPQKTINEFPANSFRILTK